MGRWGILVLLSVSLALILLVPLLVGATGDPEDDEEWEDFDDDELLGAGTSSEVGSALRVLPQMTDQNADRILNSTEYVLLLGYASWCKQSAALMVDFAEAADILAAKDSPVVLVKVDAIANVATAKRYKIKGYPTVIFIKNGSGETYTAGQTANDIVNWVQKMTGRPGTTFTSVEEAKELQRRNATVVVGIFERFEGPEYEEFIASSIKTEDVEFLQTTSAEAAKVFSDDFADRGPAVGIWKNEPENFVKFRGKLRSADVTKFIALNKYPLVTKVHARNVARVYRSPVKKQVILFSNNKDYESLYALFSASAKEFNGKLIFLWVDVEDEQFAKPMTTMYGISDSEPVVAGFDNNNGSRYLLESEVTTENLQAFATNFKEGRLKLHYKSEQIPKKNRGDVKVVVGKTFEKLVLKNSKDVLLLVYTPYCKDCDSLNKMFVKLAKHFKGLSSIIFAKLDATANEHPELGIYNYPKVLFYRASTRNDPPVEAPSKPVLKKLVHFVDENHVKVLSVSKEDANDEAKSTDTEKDSPLIVIEVPTPVDEVLGSDEQETSSGIGDFEIIRTEDNTLEGPAVDVGSSIADIEVLGIVRDPTVTSLEQPLVGGTEDETVPAVKLDKDIQEQNNKDDTAAVKQDSEKSVSPVTGVDVLQPADIPSDPALTNFEEPVVVPTGNGGLQNSQNLEKSHNHDEL